MISEPISESIQLMPIGLHLGDFVCIVRETVIGVAVLNDF